MRKMMSERTTFLLRCKILAPLTVNDRTHQYQVNNVTMIIPKKATVKMTVTHLKANADIQLLFFTSR